MRARVKKLTRYQAAQIIEMSEHPMRCCHRPYVEHNYDGWLIFRGQGEWQAGWLAIVEQVPALSGEGPTQDSTTPPSEKCNSTAGFLPII